MPTRLPGSVRFIAPFIAAVAFAHLATAAADAAIPKDLVKAELTVDVATAKPGVPFTLGVRLTIKPAWHVYWKNPGDSGAPTRVKWNLPAGFTAGDLQFPIPKRIELPGDEVNFGYEDEVMLLATITPPADLPPGKAIDLSADVSWLVCEKVCIPGKATVKLSLPVGDATTPANEDFFAKWRKRLPVPAEKLSGVGVEAKPLDLSSGNGATEIVSTVKLTDLAFPDAVEGLDLKIDPPQTDSHNLTRYPVAARVLKGQQVTAKYVEVLVGPYQVKIPIIGAADPATAPSKR